MKRAFRKHLPRLLKAAIGVVCLALVACRIPGLGSPAAGEASVKLASLHGIESLVFSGRDPRDGLTRKGPAFDTTIRGHVAFPGKFGVQASSNTVVSSTGLQLRDAGGATVVVGKTDADGNFELSLNGYEPSSAPGVTYQLEATKSLGGNGTGKDAVRFRTFLRWTGTAWKSITRNEIVISALTTALTIESSLDPANVQPIDTIDKVDHGSPLSGDAFKNGGHPDTEINALASAILGYLAGDVDPVHAVTAIKPRIDGITATAEVGQAVRIDGVGFSPLLSGNTVKFASDQVASIFLATPTSLIVAVPPGAITGPVTVATSLGTSAGVPFTVKPSAAGSGAAIANIVPPTAVPGETINIVGTGFSSSPGANVITFGGNKVATPASASATVLTVVVPAGAKNGNVSLVVGGTSRTNEFFFRVSQPTISSILPESGGPNDAITIMGASFGGLGTVRFNGSGGVDAPAVDSWSDTRVVARVPEPQVGKKVSGPLMIVNAAGAASEPFGSFVASTSISDTFATQANFDSSNSSSVVWGPNGIKAVGEDGDLTVNVGQTRTLGASDAPRSLLAANAAAGSQNLTLSSAAGFVPGMEVFLIQLWSTGAGNWETRKITAVNGNTLTLDAPVSKSYLASSSMVQKIPHYNNVVVSGKLTTLSVASSGVTGGFLVFRAKSVVVNSGGSIDVSGLGATGGAGPSAQGGRPNGGNARANGSNGGGAGGAFVSCDRGWGGGGGGYGDGGTSSSPLGGSTKGGQGGSSSGSNGGGGASSEACGSNFAGGGGGRWLRHGRAGRHQGDPVLGLAALGPGGGGWRDAGSLADLPRSGRGRRRSLRPERLGHGRQWRRRHLHPDVESHQQRSHRGRRDRGVDGRVPGRWRRQRGLHLPECRNDVVEPGVRSRQRRFRADGQLLQQQLLVLRHPGRRRRVREDSPVIFGAQWRELPQFGRRGGQSSGRNSAVRQQRRRLGIVERVRSRHILEVRHQDVGPDLYEGHRGRNESKRFGPRHPVLDQLGREHLELLGGEPGERAVTALHSLEGYPLRGCFRGQRPVRVLLLIATDTRVGQSCAARAHERLLGRFVGNSNGHAAGGWPWISPWRCLRSPRDCRFWRSVTTSPLP